MICTCVFSVPSTSRATCGPCPSRPFRGSEGFCPKYEPPGNFIHGTSWNNGPDWKRIISPEKTRAWYVFRFHGLFRTGHQLQLLIRRPDSDCQSGLPSGTARGGFEDQLIGSPMAVPDGSCLGLFSSGGSKYTSSTKAGDLKPAEVTTSEASPVIIIIIIIIITITITITIHLSS